MGPQVTDLYPLKLAPKLVPKPWGRPDLTPFYGMQSEPIGEAWFHFEENNVTDGPLAGESIAKLMVEYGKGLMGSSWTPLSLQRTSAGDIPDGGASQPYFPILTTRLFTEESLSVQVHPNDDYAFAKTGGAGKTEMWHVVDARPGSRVALGLTEPLVGKDLAEAAQSGEIEQYLNWIEVRKGDTLFVAAGLVHALDKGLTLCEIQQNSDITYRFYDWRRRDAAGNPRELHIEDAVNCIRHDLNPQTPSDGSRIASCHYFEVDRLEWTETFEFNVDPTRSELLIVIEGQGSLAAQRFEMGDAFLIPATVSNFSVQPEGRVTIVRAFRP